MPRISYMGDGETTEFTFDFPYFENTDIVVTKNGDATTGSGSWVATYLPASKGQSIRITYTTAGTTNSFLFIYANGAE